MCKPPKHILERERKRKLYIKRKIRMQKRGRINLDLDNFEKKYQYPPPMHQLKIKFFHKFNQFKTKKQCDYEFDKVFKSY